MPARFAGRGDVRNEKSRRCVGAVGSVVASDMPTKAPMVTPAVTSKRYLRVTLSPITWMSNIKSIADAAPAVGDA